MSLASDYNRYNTQFPATEVIDYILWDTVTFTSASTVSLTAFNAVRASQDLGNMEIPSQLPSPKAFFVRSIGVYFKVQPRVQARAATTNITTGITNDIANLINTGVLRLVIGSKIYAEFPLWMLPAGGGLWPEICADGNTADPGNVIDYANNGMPSIDNQYSLPKPLFIAPQINFQVQLTWPAVITIAFGNPPVCIAMQGDLLRPVQ